MAISPGRTMPRKKRSEHYVNNKEFLAALIKYREDVEIAKLRDRPKPVIPRYIGNVHDAKEVLEKLYKKDSNKKNTNS